MRPAILLAAALIGSTALAFSLPAHSAPLINSASFAQTLPVNDVTNVQYRRHGYRHGGHYGHRRGGGNGAAALGIGIAAGAILGGAIAASQAQANQNASYCAQRYRSYDPRSGTYLNNDGNRYPCP